MLCVHNCDVPQSCAVIPLDSEGHLAISLPCTSIPLIYERCIFALLVTSNPHLASFAIFVIFGPRVCYSIAFAEGYSKYSCIRVFE